jgi:penicillin-binding protein 2
MGGAVRAGTARAAYRADVAVGGKTGTAQVVATEAAGDVEDRPEALRNHAWFVGVAPLDEPRITVAVLVEHGGSGGRTAAPLGGELISTWLRLERADAEGEGTSVITVAGGATR